MPGMPPPKPNLNISTANGGAADFGEQGRRIIATQLKGSAQSFGSPSTASKLGIAMPTSGSSTPMVVGNSTPMGGNSSPGQTPAPTLPSPTNSTPVIGGLQPSPAVIIKAAQAFATEDHGPNTAPPLPPPPLVVVPAVADGIGVPQGSGLAEYNVSTPYADGPGLNPNDVTPVEHDASGRPVLTIKTPKGKSSKSWLLWVGAALAAAYYL